MKKAKIYIAGPDVFLPESHEIGENLKAICNTYGVIGLYPLDNQTPNHLTDQHEVASWIAQANIALIREADYVIANLCAFRGHEPDSGTCFEVGMAIALGKPVFAYFEDHRPLNEKVRVDANNLDSEGFYVENFDLPLNLMLSTTWTGAFKTAEEAISAAAIHHWKDSQVRQAEEPSGN